MSESRMGEALRNGCLRLLVIGAFVSFVHGFCALMSHAWPEIEGHRVALDTWALSPPLPQLAAVPALADGVEVSIARYAYDVGGARYTVPQPVFDRTPAESAAVHHLSAWPQIAYADPGFPWPTLVAIPVLLCLLALRLTRSRRITRALEETAAARERIAARKPILR